MSIKICLTQFHIYVGHVLETFIIYICDSELK